MTYLEIYRQCGSIDEIKMMAKSDTKIALFLGGNPDRLKAIEDAMNTAILEREESR